MVEKQKQEVDGFFKWTYVNGYFWGLFSMWTLLSGILTPLIVDLELLYGLIINFVIVTIIFIPLHLVFRAGVNRGENNKV